MNTPEYQALCTQLIRHEGCRLKPYRDSLGILTIGVGRNIQERGITEAEAAYLLGNDIDRCLKELNDTYPWFPKLDVMRQRVWIDLCFNMGITRLKDFKQAAAAMAHLDYATAALELKDSRWYTQVGRRGPYLCEMLRTGKEPETEEGS